VLGPTGCTQRNKSVIFPFWFLCVVGHCRLSSSRIGTHSQWQAVCLVLGTFAKFRKATVIVVMSVRLPAWNNFAPTGRSFMKFDIWVFFENLLRKFELDYNLTSITGTLHEDQCTCVIISRSVLLRMRNVSDKSCRENRNTHFVFNNILENCAFYEIMRKNIVEPNRRQDNTALGHWMQNT
jgi:hypothetical protein